MANQTNLKTPTTNSANQASAKAPTAPPKINSVIDEINRGREYTRLREQRQSLESKVKPSYEPDKHLYPDVYVKKCIVPDYTPNYEQCRHIKHNVINRDELDIQQHIDLLAQPRFVRKFFFCREQIQ